MRNTSEPLRTSSTSSWPTCPTSLPSTSSENATPCLRSGPPGGACSCAIAFSFGRGFVRLEPHLAGCAQSVHDASPILLPRFLCRIADIPVRRLKQREGYHHWPNCG